MRAFPDDCLVDSFEPELSDGELDAVEHYWAEIWSAAGDVDRQRAAWRALVAGHGSGRAAWISGQHAPLNPGGAGPRRVAASDVFLAIPLHAPLTGTEPADVTTYWSAIWRAGDDAAALAAARAALVAAVGSQRAAELVAGTTPSNLGEQPAAPLTRADVTVSVAFLLLPPRPPAKAASWTQPATAALMPDRLVLLGYANGTRVLEQLGAPLPPRLVVGPDPSAAAAGQLHDENGELIVPDELRWLVDFDRAVQDGLGFRVPLDDATRAGLDRLLVVGLRLSTDATETKAQLETLLEHHQHGQAGLALVRQGTPTNNTDRSPSGVSRVDDPDASFVDPFAPVPRFTWSSDWLLKRDGQWLAEWLGVDTSAFLQVPGPRGATNSRPGRCRRRCGRRRSATWRGRCCSRCSTSARSWRCARSSRVSSAAADPCRPCGSARSRMGSCRPRRSRGCASETARHASPTCSTHSRRGSGSHAQTGPGSHRALLASAPPTRPSRCCSTCSGSRPHRSSTDSATPRAWPTCTTARTSPERASACCRPTPRAMPTRGPTSCWGGSAGSWASSPRS